MSDKAGQPAGDLELHWPLFLPVWRNLYFTRSGSTFWGDLTYSTETECNAGARQFFNELAAFIEGGGDLDETVLTWSGFYVPLGEITFILQMPWHE